MTRPLLLLAAAHVLSLAACAGAGGGPLPRDRPLQPFRSQEEWAEYQARLREEGERLSRDAPPPQMIIEPMPMLPPPPPPARPLAPGQVPAPAPAPAPM